MAGFIVLALAYVLSQFFRSFLAVLAPVLTRELSVDAGNLANASGAWFVLFALMQFPVGVWLDRFGPRRTAGYLLAIAAGGGAAMFAMSENANHLIVAMALIGIGCSPVLMAAVYQFAQNYAAASFATLSSTFIAVGTLGNIVSSAPMSAAVEAFGWRDVSWALCAITIIVAIGILILVRDPVKISLDAGRRGAQGYWTLMKIPQLWLIFPCITLSYAVAAGIRGLWVGPYFEQVHNLDDLEIGRMTFYMAVALSAGSLFYGPLDRIFDSRKKVVLTGNAIVAAAALWLAVAFPRSVDLAVMLTVLIGFFGGSYAVLIAHGKAFIPARLTGRGVTLMNFFAIGGVGLMQITSGVAFESWSSLGDSPLSGYQAVFLLYALALATVLLIYAFSLDAKPSQG